MYCENASGKHSVICTPATKRRHTSSYPLKVQSSKGSKTQRRHIRASIPRQVESKMHTAKSHQRAGKITTSNSISFAWPAIWEWTCRNHGNFEATNPTKKDRVSHSRISFFVSIWGMRIRYYFLVGIQSKTPKHTRMKPILYNTSSSSSNISVSNIKNSVNAAPPAANTYNKLWNRYRGFVWCLPSNKQKAMSSSLNSSFPESRWHKTHRFSFDAKTGCTLAWADTCVICLRQMFWNKQKRNFSNKLPHH